MPVARSRAKPPRGYIGTIPEPTWEVLRIAWEDGLSIQSNIARTLAAFVGLAASLGWISTITLDGKQCTGVWNITLEGVMALTSRGT